MDTAKDGTPNHQIVSRVLTRVFPEGLAMSPAAKWVVTTNLEQSTPPFENPKQGFYSTLTLIHLNAESGMPDRIGEFACDAILPESAVFVNTKIYCCCQF